MTVGGRARAGLFSSHPPRGCRKGPLFCALVLMPRQQCWHQGKKKPPPKAGVSKAAQECDLVSTPRSFISSRTNTSQTNWHCDSWVWTRSWVGTAAGGALLQAVQLPPSSPGWRQRFRFSMRRSHPFAALALAAVLAGCSGDKTASEGPSALSGPITIAIDLKAPGTSEG